MAGTIINVAKLVTQLVADPKEFAKGLGKAKKDAFKWSEAMKVAIANAGIGLLVDAGKKAVQVAGRMGKAFSRLATNAAPLATIGTIFEQNAQRFGVSLDAFRKAAGGTISDFKLMTQANEALIGVSQDLGEQMGKQLPSLLEGARAAARATGKDVGFLFESLVNGVKKASPLLIDNTGLVLSLGEANESLAKKLGKTVEQLTQDEKSLAILNATTAAATKLTEQYGSAQLTVAEKLQRAQAAGENFKDKAGLALQPVLSNLLDRFDEMSQRVLPPLIGLFENRIAPILDIVVDKVGGFSKSLLDAGTSVRQFVNFTTDGMGNMVPVVEDAGQSAFETLSNKFSEGAENALRWGINISTELATGLVQGASQAIVAAMQFIGNLLSSWLGPGSPPKVYPTIDKDGAATFETYLKGFGGASFEILEGLQAPLQKALTTLVDAGQIGADAARGTFKNLSVEIAAAADQMQRTGKIGAAIFEKLEAAGGEYGDELASLARAQFKLAGATREVQVAEESLANARKASEEAQTQVDKLADEFNKLLAAGADPAILDAKRAEFAEAEKQLELSQEQIAAAEEQKETAEGQIDPLQEQADLQQKVLDQILAMSDAQKKVAEEAVKALAGGAAGALPGLELPVPKLPAPDFSAVTEMFTTQKALLAEKFAGLFAPITEAWENDIKPTLKTLGEEWTKFTGIVQKFWDEKVKPLIEPFKKFIPPDLARKFGKFAGVVLVAAAALGVLLLAIAVLTSPFTLLAAGIAIIVIFGEDAIEMFKNLQSQFIIIRDFVKNKLIVTFGNLAVGIQVGIMEALIAVRDFVRDKIGPILTSFKEKVLDPLGESFKAVSDFIKGIIDKFATFFDKMKEAKDSIPPWMRSDSPTPLEVGLRGIGDAMNDLANFQLPQLTTSLEMLPAGVGAFGLGGTSETNFNMTVNTQATTPTVVQDFETARALLGP